MLATIPEGTQKVNGRVMPLPQRPAPAKTLAERRAEVLAQPETEISLDEGLRVSLGGVEYEIAPLSIRDSRAWRRSWSETVKRIGAADDQELAFNLTDWVADLFFSYAIALDREEVEGVATEAELVAAYNAVCEYVNRPFR